MADERAEERPEERPSERPDDRTGDRAPSSSGRDRIERFERGVLEGDRTLMAQAITLVESSRQDDADDARELVARLWLRSGGARRVGVSGPPGVGKSTFIEALGMWLVERGHRVAVLAVDPSSTLSGGSILGDKARMGRLAVHPNAYIRPSPSAATLGGVARRTREAMVLCEAAGFDVLLIETVGVGQSETAVADMVDFFLVLALPGAGDELQGIKKGILELADLIAVNKADGDNIVRARTACREYAAALRYLRPKSDDWQPRAITVSALTGDGLDECWTLIEEHRTALEESGALKRRRGHQLVRWMWQRVEEGLVALLRTDAAVQTRLPGVEAAVAAGSLSPASAADTLLAALADSTPRRRT
jgi:LAO/AO transport system kinase